MEEPKHKVPIYGKDEPSATGYVHPITAYNSLYSYDTEQGNTEPPYLEWKEKRKLVKLSGELWEKGYISKTKDFEKVFTKKEECKWNKDCASLAYLIKQLHKMGLVSVVGAKSNAYFKVSELYFCDFSGNVAKNFHLKSGLHNMKERPSKTHAYTKQMIDFILNNIK